MRTVIIAISLCCATSAWAICSPGWVDTTLGKCMPDDAQECGTGYCTKGWFCSDTGTCRKYGFLGTGSDGPICPGYDLPCPSGTACGPQGQCYFPDKTHVCPDGKIYVLSDACPE
jgi:hypothetical protein